MRLFLLKNKVSLFAGNDKRSFVIIFVIIVIGQ